MQPGVYRSSTTLNTSCGRIRKRTTVLILLCGVLLATQHFGIDESMADDNRAEVVVALDDFVSSLEVHRPADIPAYVKRIEAYLDSNPAFYGSAVALLDDAGEVVASPYVYRVADGYKTLDLTEGNYDVATQVWFTMPMEAGEGVWTQPYFDAGGGEIWMVTRSVPARGEDGVFAIVTTDLPVEAPQQ